MFVKNGKVLVIHTHRPTVQPIIFSECWCPSSVALFPQPSAMLKNRDLLHSRAGRASKCTWEYLIGKFYGLYCISSTQEYFGLNFRAMHQFNKFMIIVLILIVTPFSYTFIQNNGILRTKYFAWSID